VSWADPEKVRQVVAVGSEQRVVFNDLNPQEPVRIFEKGVGQSSVPTNFGEQFAMRNGDIISPNIGLSEPLKEQCLHFIDCVLQGTRPLTDGQAGLEVVRVMVAIDESLKRKGLPIELTNERENGHHKQAVGQAVADLVR
jgi:predicted dehydrogenase